MARPLLAAEQMRESLTKLLGPKTGNPLRDHLGLETVEDLLRYYPRAYLRLGELTEISSLPQEEPVSLVGEVLKVSIREMKSRRGKIMDVVVTDGTQPLPLTFFNNVFTLKRDLTLGRRALFSGKVTKYRGRLELVQPTYELLDDGEQDPDRLLERLAIPHPVYKAAGKIDSAAVRTSVRTVLDVLSGEPADPIPAALRLRLGLIDLGSALRQIHRPADERQLAAAKSRLIFEEAFVLQVALARRRAADSDLLASAVVELPDGLLAALERRLPFTLTAGQREVGAQIAADLARTQPMHRLLQGEVGSGKTLVALRAMLSAVDGGGQAALLAPTEVLAAQHHHSISALLGSLAAAGMLGAEEIATRVVLLTGSLPVAARRASLLDAASGAAGIVVGTHALLQDKVQFQNLTLVVVDEQHRFGVHQRDALRAKGKTVPHLLVMTATPIPRTVAMTVFGDLETSTLRELPAGRPPIASHVVDATKDRWMERTWQRLAEEATAGHQAYVVCPRIGALEGEGEEDDLVEVESATFDPARRPPLAVLDVLAELRVKPSLAGLVIEALHGRMPAEEREWVMRRFAAGEVDILVATTVIEVGVDVANATAMVVLDAERFGVSQLHQLRGRVGRGSAGGLCLLVSDLAEPASMERLRAVAATLDGFELAQLDLQQRREGDVLGAAQSGGKSSLRLLKVLRDEKVIESARREATAVIAADPRLRLHPALAAALGGWLDEEQMAFLDRG